MPEKSGSQGRYFLSSAPVASPGQCGICGYSNNDRQYLDPRLDFEFYGSLIFCQECVESMSAMFGSINPAQAQALEARVEEAERQLIKLRAVVATIEDFRVAIASIDGGASPVSGGSRSSDVPDAVTGGPVAVSKGIAASGAGADKPSDKPAAKQGRDDLRDAQPSASSELSL